MSEVGDLLAGRYRLRQHLGSGAMGSVWLADDERLQRQVAVKELLQAGAGGAAGNTAGDTDEAARARERAMREGRIAARLHHPNAVAVHDVTEHAGSPLLVMEYFPATSLADALASGGPLPPAAAARIGGQVADALAAAHAAGIVHRDVQPANVLLAPDGTAKIVDFGIAHAGGDLALTQTGLVAGTPAYLAPEVARGQDPSPASDVFSLGALLYAAVQGTPPFGDGTENPMALLQRVAAGTVPAPDRAGPLTPVLSALLAPDPRQRPDARQVREAARAVAEGRTPPALTPADADGHTQPIPPVPAAPPPAPPGGAATAAGAAAPGTRLDLHPFDGDPTGHGQAHPAGPPPAGHAAAGHAGSPSSGARRGRRTRLAVGGGILAVGVLVTALLLGSGGQDPAPEAGPTSTTPPASSSTVPAVSAAEARQAVADYYALLPDRPDAAWERLGPELRAKGRDSFDDRFSGVRKLTVVSEPRMSGEETVHIGVRLRMRDDSTVTEFHQHELVRLDGAVLLRTDTVLHAETSTPPKDDEKKKDENKDDDKDDEKDKKDRGRGERENDKEDDDN